MQLVVVVFLLKLLLGCLSKFENDGSVKNQIIKMEKEYRQPSGTTGFSPGTCCNMENMQCQNI